jgi:hypothetical protein
MIHSQTQAEQLDAILQKLYSEAPEEVVPRRVPDTLDAPQAHLDRLVAHARPVDPEPPEDPEAIRLDALPRDALQVLYEHVSLPFVLKLTCRALRAAHPQKTLTKLSHIVKSSWRFRWACRVGCPFVWNTKLASGMALHGGLHALAWARNEGLPWDEETTAAAARGGHLNVLAWATEAGCSINCHRCACTAAGKGHLPILKWLERWYPRSAFLTTWAVNNAAKSGHLETLKWLREDVGGHPRCPWDAWCVSYAASKGHLELIQWAVQNGARVRSHAMAGAAEFGHMHVVKWLRTNGHRMSAHVCASAAAGGQLEVLQYLRSGPLPWCPWDRHTRERAAERMHAEVLQWAIDNGCPGE